MKIIWALYDDGNMSWYNSDYDKNEFKIISVGINDHHNLNNYYKIDLSLNNNNLIKQLDKLEKPDIIVASPPCESWSNADNQQRLYRNYKKEQNNNYDIFTLHSYHSINENNLKFKNNLQRNYYKQFHTFLNGLSTVLGLEYIINYFKPEIFIIENPQSSKIWDIINRNTGPKLEGYYNLSYYNCYDHNFSKKPTYFYSNIKLNLKNYNIKSIQFNKINGYDNRSKIPKELIKNILENIKIWYNNNGVK